MNNKMVKKITNFKIALVSIIFLVSNLNTFAQSKENVLKVVDSMALKMFNDMNNRDYDAILDMTHPKVFEIVPKESMKGIFKSMFEGNEDFSIEIPQTIPKYKISEIFEIENDTLQFAFVSYDMEMNMTFNKQEFDEASKETMVSMMKTKGIDVDFVSDNTLEMLMRDRMTIILKDNSTNDKWVMINYDPDSPLFYQIVSSSLLEKAKEYNQNLMLQSKKESED
jgi:hypothetical protein